MIAAMRGQRLCAFGLLKEACDIGREVTDSLPRVLSHKDQDAAQAPKALL